MNNKDLYIKSLLSAFNECKKISKEEEIVIKFTNDYRPSNLIMKFPEIENFPSFSIVKHSGNYIRLSGVFVLYYLVVLYLRLQDIDQGEKYVFDQSKDKLSQKIKLLKKTVFIFEENEDSLIYYPISKLKENGFFEF